MKMNAVLAASSFASICAHAEVVTIPFSAALPRYIAGENCIDLTLSFTSDNQPCLLRFSVERSGRT
jgi:hypothetical protein